MTLREVLDEVRFGNVGRLCIAVCGKYDFLEHFKKGQYWELECGNWHEGSRSQTTPEMPEEFMDAEVTQIECETNVADIYFNLGKLRKDNWNYTVVLVEEPDGYDAEKYWSEDNQWAPIVPIEWPYAIDRNLWYEIQKMDSNWFFIKMAIGTIGNIGFLTIREYTDEDFEEMSPLDAQVYRLAKQISLKINGVSEVMAMLQLAEMGSAFQKNL